MKENSKAQKRHIWQERVRMAGAVTLTLLALVGLFVAVGPRTATGQSIGILLHPRSPALSCAGVQMSPERDAYPEKGC